MDPDEMVADVLRVDLAHGLPRAAIAAAHRSLIVFEYPITKSEANGLDCRKRDLSL